MVEVEGGWHLHSSNAWFELVAATATMWIAGGCRRARAAVRISRIIDIPTGRVGRARQQRQRQRCLLRMPLDVATRVHTVVCYSLDEDTERNVAAADAGVVLLGIGALFALQATPDGGWGSGFSEDDEALCVCVWRCRGRGGRRGMRVTRAARTARSWRR